jgi:hypothetical protein
MLPLEFYWPPEMLAQVFPGKYGHLTTPKSDIRPTTKTRAEPTRFTSQRLDSGCVVIWLGRKDTGRAHLP